MYSLFHVQWPSFVRVFQSYHSLTRVYYYVINEEGQPTYIGTHTSVISYNKSISSWIWWEWTGFYANSLKLLFARYDKKDPSSEAVSRSSPASLLLGLQKMSSFIFFSCPVSFFSCPVSRQKKTHSGVHNMDFSGVRDDKCDTGIGQVSLQKPKQ